MRECVNLNQNRVVRTEITLGTLVFALRRLSKSSTWAFLWLPERRLLLNRAVFLIFRLGARIGLFVKRKPCLRQNQLLWIEIVRHAHLHQIEFARGICQEVHLLDEFRARVVASCRRCQQATGLARCFLKNLL